MEFACCVCRETFVSIFVPAKDYRTDGNLCPPCYEERRDFWGRNLVFTERVRMSELDLREVWE